jgi:hypothetical protein
MPRFDGTGPLGEGPMTGRGEGYCAVQIPEPGQQGQGYVGLQGSPVRVTGPAAPPCEPSPRAMWRWPVLRGAQPFGGRRGRSRWFRR